MVMYGSGWQNMVVFSDCGIYRYCRFLLIVNDAGHKVSKGESCIVGWFRAIISCRVSRVRSGLHQLRLVGDVEEG